MINSDDRIEVGKSLLSQLLLVTEHTAIDPSPESTQVLMEWNWAADTLLACLGHRDPVRAVKAMAQVAQARYTGEPDRWSLLWQLALETQDCVAGHHAPLRESVQWIVRRAARQPA
jgi:hypothetical protein